MNSPIEMIEVTCPVCGGVFAEWLDRSSDEPAATRCPTCGHDLSADPLIRKNGPWPLIEEDDRVER